MPSVGTLAWYAIVGVFVIGAGALIWAGAIILDGKRWGRIPPRPRSTFDKGERYE